MTVNIDVRRQVCTVVLGVGVVMSIAQHAKAQSALLPGQNLAQQTMALSIDRFCGPLQGRPGNTPSQMNLAAICRALQNDAEFVRTGDRRSGPTFGFTTANQVNSALQQLNGGAELLVPTDQASLLQNTQSSRQTAIIEARLSRQRELMVASAEFSRAGQLAASDATPEFTQAIGPLGVFATGLGRFGSRDLTTSENGYSFNNAGFLTGVDYRFNRRLVAGMAFGYTRTNVSFDTSTLSASGQFLNNNMYQGNLFAGYSFTDALYMNAIAVFGGGSNKSRRHIVIPSVDSNPPLVNQIAPVDQIATGSFGNQVKGVTVSSGYALPFGPLLVTPNIGLSYQHTGVDAFRENAFSVNMQYGGSSVNTVVSSLGVDAQYTISTSLGALYPNARFRWFHQYSPGNTSVSPGFINDATGLSPFVLPGTPTSRNYFDLGVGVALQLSPNSSAFINYDSVLGIRHTNYNSFTGGIRLTF